MADDDDFDELFAAFEEEDSLDSLHISANLLDIAGANSSTAAQDGSDGNDGMKTWVAPSFAGLDNSHSVDTVSVGSHWYKEEKQTPAQVLAASDEIDVTAASESKATKMAEAESALWNEVLPATPGTPEVVRKDMMGMVSENLLKAISDSDSFKAAKSELDSGQAAKTAELFERLAAHGHGVVVLSKHEFSDLVHQLQHSTGGRELLGLLVERKKRRASVITPPA